MRKKMDFPGAFMRKSGSVYAWINTTNFYFFGTSRGT